MFHKSPASVFFPKVIVFAFLFAPALLEAQSISWNHPDGYNATSGQSYSLTASVSGYPTPTIYLYKNGSLVATGPYTATTTQVDTGPATKSYYATSTNGGYGSRTINIVKLNQAAVSSSNYTKTYGDSFAPSISGGSGTGNYQWLLGGYLDWPLNGEAGTRSGSTVYTSWTPHEAKSYSLWVRRVGDVSYYDAPGVNHSLTVNKRSITITRSGSKTYNGNTTPTGASASITSGSLASGDSISYSFGNTSSANAGSYSIAVTPTITNASSPTNRTGSYNISYAGSYTINKANQPTPSISSSSSTTYGNSYTATATGGSSGAGAYSFELVSGSTASGAAINSSSGAVTFKSNGTVKFRVRRLGNSNYNTSSWSSTFTLTVNKRSITVTRSGSKTYNANTTPTGAGASITSGSLASGDSIGYSFGNTSSANAGSYAIAVTPTISNASSPTNRTGSYNISYAGTYTINQASQSAPTVTASQSFTYGNSHTATASGGGGQGGLQWERTGGTASGGAINSSSGAVSANSTGTVAVRARWLGNTNYTASGWSSSVNITVGARPITITRSGSKAYDGNTSPSGASASITSGSLASGDSIGYSFGITSSPDVGTYAIAVTPTISNASSPTTRTGSYNISYAGTYSIAISTQSAPTVTASQSFTYGNSYTATASGGGGQGTLQWELTGGTASGGAIDFNTGAVSATSTGTVTGRARWSGNSSYASSPWSSSVAITVSTRSITITRSGSKVYNGNTSPTGASASITSGSLASGDSISYSFGNTSSANAASYSITVTPTITNATSPTTRTGSYNISYGGSYTITQASNTISFPVIADQLIGNPQITLNATSTSGLSVSYSIVSGSASVSSNTLTLGSTPGDVTVRASQAGNTNYAAATNVDRTFHLFDPSGDADGDGLPNGWEMQNNLDPEDDQGDDGADGDPDNDGISNLMEFLWSTNPQTTTTASPMTEGEGKPLEVHRPRE